MTNAPQTKILHSGNSLKIIQVNGSKGMKMPEHVSTKEAVISVQKGLAILKMNGIEYPLTQNQSFIIPGDIKHTLSIEEEFQAVVTMNVDSEIRFLNS